MLDEPQNPSSEQNSIPPSPQEPSEPAPENTVHSEPSIMPPDVLEAPRNSENAISVNNDNSPLNKSETISPESGEAPEMLENQGSSESKSSSTAQMAGNAPLAGTEQTETSEPEPSKSKPETSKPTEATPPLAYKTFRNTTKENLAKAQLTIQNKKRKKLDLILTLFAKRKSITNDEVEKFLHVSDATATRYLSILEKENKIKQMGKTGHMVSYSKI